MNAIRPIRVAQLLNAIPAQPPAPPLGVRPTRFGEGRVELLIYPGATAIDRIRGAITLLQGTGYRIVKED
jgi:hypothetical protein